MYAVTHSEQAFHFHFSKKLQVVGTVINPSLVYNHHHYKYVTQNTFWRWVGWGISCVYSQWSYTHCAAESGLKRHIHLLSCDFRPAMPWLAYLVLLIRAQVLKPDKQAPHKLASPDTINRK